MRKQSAAALGGYVKRNGLVFAEHAQLPLRSLHPFCHGAKTII